MLAAYGPFSRQCDRRKAYLALTVVVVAVTRPWQPSVTIITIGLLRTAAGPLLALYFDAGRRLVAALTGRAERERDLPAEQARAEERARLAAEMHDVMTHRVSPMVLQVGALRMTAADEATWQAAEELRAAGCQALAEPRDLAGILGAGPEADQTPAAAGLAAPAPRVHRGGDPGRAGRTGVLGARLAGGRACGIPDRA